MTCDPNRSISYKEDLSRGFWSDDLFSKWNGYINSCGEADKVESLTKNLQDLSVRGERYEKALLGVKVNEDTEVLLALSNGRAECPFGFLNLAWNSFMISMNPSRVDCLVKRGNEISSVKLSELTENERSTVMEAIKSTGLKHLYSRFHYNGNSTHTNVALEETKSFVKNIKDNDFKPRYWDYTTLDLSEEKSKPLTQ